MNWLYRLLFGFLVLLFVLALIQALAVWALNRMAEAGTAVTGAAGDLLESSGNALASYAQNPFFLLALAGVVVLVLWYMTVNRWGGPEVVLRRVRTRLMPAGIADYVLKHKLKSVWAAGTVSLLLFFGAARYAGVEEPPTMIDFLILFVPFSGVVAYAGRRQRRKESGEGNPDAPVVRRREIPCPIWSLKRWEGAPGGREVWHVAGESYKSRGKYEHVLISGRTGIGKGQTVLAEMAAHSIACGVASTVVVDPKAEVYDELKALIAAQPDNRPTHLFSTLEEHPDEICAGINPMSGPEETARFAASVVPDSDEPIWGEGARDLIEAVAEAYGYPDDCVLRVADALASPRMLEDLKRTEAGEEIGSHWQGQDERMSESIRKTAAIVFKPIRRQKRVARLFRGSCDPGGELDLTGRRAVFICVDPRDAKTSGNLIAGLVDTIYNRGNEAGKRGGPGVEMIVDEAGTFLSVHKFPEYLSIARGNRVRFALVVQNYSQLQSRLGGSREKVMDMLDSLSLKVYGQTGDEFAAEYMARASGEVRVRREGPNPKIPLWRIPFTGIRQRYLANRARFADEMRTSLKADHVRSLPEGQWYILTSDGIEHVAGKPWYSHYKDRLIPPEAHEKSPNLAGIPAAPAGPEETGGGEPGRPAEDPGRPQEGPRGGGGGEDPAEPPPDPQSPDSRVVEDWEGPGDDSPETGGTPEAETPRTAHQDGDRVGEPPEKPEGYRGPPSAGDGTGSGSPGKPPETGETAVECPHCEHPNPPGAGTCEVCEAGIR